MSPEVILGAIIVGPIAVLMLLRINAAIVFLSLCLGDVLQQFVAPDGSSLLALFSAHAPSSVSTASVTNDNLRLALLLVPPLLTAFFMVRTVRKGLGLILNLLPAAGVGLLASLLVVPLLPASLTSKITDSSSWQQVQRAQVLVVGVSALVCLLALWMQRPKTGHEAKHGKKHKE